MAVTPCGSPWTHTCTHAHRDTPKGWKGIFKVISHFSSLFLFSLFPVDSFTPNNLLACGERSHVEKCRSTCNTISKWLAPQRAPSRPVYLDEVVHCTLSAYGFKPDSVCTINNSFCLHVWLTASVCLCVCVCFTAAVQLCYWKTQLVLLPSSLSLLWLVWNTTLHNKLPREGEHTQICPYIKY